jgi:hypothetical protein
LFCVLVTVMLEQHERQQELVSSRNVGLCALLCWSVKRAVSDVTSKNAFALHIQRDILLPCVKSILFRFERRKIIQTIRGCCDGTESWHT